jgi:hypothetical protein
MIGLMFRRKYERARSSVADVIVSTRRMVDRILAAPRRPPLELAELRN